MTPRFASDESRRRTPRKGVFVVLAAIVLVVLFAFISFGIDTGLISLEQARMQNGVDAAALAASQEITAAVADAGENGNDPNSISITHAKQMAVDVAAANGVYLNADRDIVFGKRTYDASSGEWTYAWNAAPYNVVKVEAHRDQTDLTAPDGRVPLAFGWAVGVPSVPLVTKATAFVEARDLVVVLDFSGSMNDDSQFRAIDRLGEPAITENLREIFTSMNPNVGGFPVEPEYLTIVGAAPTIGCMPQIKVTFKGTEIYAESTKDLSNVVLEFDDGYRYKFDDLHQGTTGTFAGVGSYSGRVITKCWVKSGCNEASDGSGYGELFADTNAAVKTAFQVNNVPYPYASGSWDEYINYCRHDADVIKAGYRNKYGGITLANFWLAKKYNSWQTADLWKAPHYPFHAVKNGFSLFLTFLDDLDFGDEVGIVSYDENSRVEHTLNEHGVYATLGGDNISDDYATLDLIQHHKQAGHYGSYTGMGHGVSEAKQLLAGQSRDGARPTMLVMTDGLANRYPSNWTLPYDWDWADYADTDGDGVADYSTSDRSKQYAFYEAVQARKNGVTIHTMSVGLDADRALMSAIANAGGGIHIEVPGGSTVAEMQEQLLDAFGKIAAKVPPPQLVYELETN
ncbi:pilus assembly protein TadG-related protein [Blastopirellula sp. JC732]|uniref:Pilus assembly protein TadG-related protein n=1 Tax=Blastopirellula sediminis TaxID=2894196 RepID=A0A9X1MP44_9BACT|nr:pilus assembly protein TadG-related protein [Blastopirellula sediminis]MCC9607240.1 pilus assembly protein TadG-related protein [Blastopirellula sediminis]MCC9629467.1 pilus assembly protein TadG-related protein [Blastopirellula sediminis]